MRRAELRVCPPEAENVLRDFLSRAVLPGKRERYLELISRPASRETFLQTLHHEFGQHLDPAKRVEALSAETLRLSGYRFQPYGHAFGEPVESLAAVTTTFDESFLVVTADGKAGIHGPEYRIDDRTFYIV